MKFQITLTSGNNKFQTYLFKSRRSLHWLKSEPMVKIDVEQLGIRKMGVSKCTCEVPTRKGTHFLGMPKKKKAKCVCAAFLLSPDVQSSPNTKPKPV